MRDSRPEYKVLMSFEEISGENDIPGNQFLKY